MNENEQRIAIMEELGWSQIEDRSEALMMPEGTCLVGYPPKGAIVGKKQELPDPIHDLNVMHEAVMGQPVETRDKINCRLCAILDSDKANILDQVINATSAQRAEAFLRVKGRWKD